MPIRAEMKVLYPENWKEISERIRRRGGNACEWCRAWNHAPHPVTGSIVVLTCAHLNHDPTDNSETNLASLCQRCHNRHDAKHRAQTRRYGVTAGQGNLFEGGESKREA